MANGIEVLIGVLASEAITTTDQFIKVITDAAGKVGILSGSIDELDTSLASIVGSGASVEEMSARLVTVLKDFGIQVNDADPLAAAFADTLKGMGVSGKEAAAGIEAAAKANEGLIGPTNAAAAAIDKESIAAAALAIRMDATAAAMKGFAAKQVSSALETQVATADMGAGYARMTTLSELATPALMKAATYAGLGLAGLAYEGIKQYTEFNKLITQTITQAGVAPSKMGFLTNLAESVAKATGQNLNDVANTIYRAASGTASWNAGLGATSSQLANIVTQVSKLNVVGAVPTGAASEQASRVITALINSNVRGVGHDPARAAALVNAAIGSGDMRLPDLVPGVGRGVLASAVANNVSAPDMLAWIATLTSQGTTASVAGNYVKTGMNLLMHPSAIGTQMLAMIGIKPGELQNIVQGPGGLTAVLKTLKAGMGQLNPSSAAQFFYHEAGIPRKGGAGLQGAIAKLQSFSAGELSPKFIQDWIARKLTPQEAVQAYDLVLTKSFGGSKQFATIAGVTNQLPLFEGILKHLNSEFNVGYFNKQYATTEATPAQQFKRMKQSIVVDLVNIGKTLTPLALVFGHAVTGIIDGLTKFKGVLYGFVGIAAALLAFAGASKVASLAVGVSPFIGAAYNRIGMMAGKDSKFTTAMNDSANGGAFKFLNIYGSKKHGILSKLGGEAINAGFNPVLDTKAIANGGALQGLSQGENALNTTVARGVTFQEKTAINTQIIADAVAGKGLSGGGFGGGGAGLGSEKQVTQAVQRDATMAAYTPRNAMYLGSGQSAGMLLAEGSVFQNAKTRRWSKMLKGGRSTFISNMEAYRSGAMQGPLALGTGSLEAGTQLSAMGSADAIALGMTSGVGADLRNAPGMLGVGEGVLGAAPALAGDVAKTGMMSRAMSGLGSIMGSPLGMMGMMAAPVLIGALVPVLGKLGSLIGGWWGGGHTPPYVPPPPPPDPSQAAKKMAAADKALHQFENLVKGKNGKPTWVRNDAMFRAHPAGYFKVLKADQKAHHTYEGAAAGSNLISANAADLLYGPTGRLLSNDINIAKRFAGPHIRGVGFGSEEQMQQLINQLPAGSAIRKSAIQMMSRNGANWKDFHTLLSATQSNARAVVSDAAGGSSQYLAKHDPMVNALIQGGYFPASANLAGTNINVKHTMNNKNLTVAQALQVLPLDAQQYRIQLANDNKVLLEKNLPSGTRLLFKDQKESVTTSLHNLDEAIREMRKVSGNTKLDNGSVSDLAKQNASALVASQFSTDIANALAKALSPYMKTSKVVGTSGPVSRSTSLVGR